MRRQPWWWAVAAVALLTFGTVHASVLLSDDFNRNAGTFDEENGVFVSDWGSNNNAAGGTLVGTYTTAWTSSGSDFNTDWVDGSVGILQFDRTINNANLATPAAVAAGGVIVQFDINPADTGLGSVNGRDWAGLGLSDTNNTTAVGGSAALANANADVRFAISPRNSGTAITKRATGTGGAFEIRAGGNPNALTEPIFDQDTYDDYVDWFNGGDGTAPGDPVEEFLNPQWYTVRMLIKESAPGAGDLFATDATNLVEVYIGEQGGPLARIDLNPSTAALEDTLVWGDNQKTAGGVAPNADPSPNGRYAYLVIGANGGGHQFDNLIVTAVPEPSAWVIASLLALGLCVAVRRRKTL